MALFFSLQLGGRPSVGRSQQQAEVVARAETARWGQPLDPEVFWRGQVIWLSSNAISRAQVVGRMLPPVPVAFANRCLGYSSVEKGGSSEQAQAGLRYTDREIAFWDWFGKTHPLPPESLDDALLSVSSRIGLSSETKWEKENGAKLGYPEELFDPTALYWGYVLAKRKEYRELIQGLGPSSGFAKRFVERAGIPTNLITGELSNEQRAAAGEWKRLYLKRLEEQGADPRYLGEYRKAWDPGTLSSNKVFGADR